MGAHAGAQRGVPPMLDITLGKLARGAHHDLFAQHRRRGPDQCHGVLQLVAKAGRAAGLIEGRLAPQPAGHGLVEQPMVHQRVEQRVGGGHDDGAQQPVPGRASALQALGGGHPRRRIGQLTGRRRVGRPAQQEHALDRAGWRHRQVSAQGCAGLATATLATAEVVGQDRPSAGVEAFAPVTGPVRGIIDSGSSAKGPERRAAPEAGAVVLLRGHQRCERCARRSLAVQRGVHRATVAAQRAEHPFDNPHQAQRARARPLVDDDNAHLPDRHFRVHAPAGRDLELAALVTDRGGALAVDDAIGAGRVAPDRWREAPHLARAQVLQQQPFAGRVGQGVVGPGRELVQPAVHRPARAAPGLGDEAAEDRVGQHVDPRPQRALRAAHLEAERAAVGHEFAVR